MVLNLVNYIDSVVLIKIKNMDPVEVVSNRIFARLDANGDGKLTKAEVYGDKFTQSKTSPNDLRNNETSKTNSDLFHSPDSEFSFEGNSRLNSFNGDLSPQNIGEQLNRRRADSIIENSQEIQSSRFPMWKTIISDLFKTDQDGIITKEEFLQKVKAQEAIECIFRPLCTLEL